MNIYTITTFEGIKQPQGKELSIDANTLKLGLLTPIKTTGDKRSIPMWSPTKFKDAKRASSNALEVNFLVYDIDDGESDFDTWRIFGEHFITLAHTSFSHRADHHKYRIIMPLLYPVPASEWGRASQVAFQIWKEAVGKGKPDSGALKDRARAYFRYALPLEGAENHRTGFSGTNKRKIYLDYERVPKPKPPPPLPKREGPMSMDEALENPRVRTRIANELRAKIMGNVARYITCPKCQKISVYFYIDITINPAKFPQCNHKNSCGWWGSFTDL